MAPSRRVLMSAIVMTMSLGLLIGALPAAAQQYEASLRALDYAPDPLARSPRLLGMGRLTLADDLHNRIGLWDFAGNPTGIAEADSLTTFEYRAGSRSSNAVHDIAGPSPTPRQRQNLSARQVRHTIETWRRAPGTTAYGLIGEMATLRWDRPYSGDVEERGKFTVPALLGAVNGRVPWLNSTRFDYSLRFGFSQETYDDLYFDFLHIIEGDYIGRPSGAQPPPDVFTPTHGHVTNLGGGMAISMRVTQGIKAAIGYDRAQASVKSTNEGERSTSRTDERRPFDLGQASIVGRLGGHLEFGADGRAWRSRSEEFFFWTVSAGPTQDPLAGDGKRLDRTEEGTSMRTRARWVEGPIEIGALSTRRSAAASSRPGIRRAARTCRASTISSTRSVFAVAPTRSCCPRASSRRGSKSVASRPSSAEASAFREVVARSEPSSTTGD